MGRSETPPLYSAGKAGSGSILVGSSPTVRRQCILYPYIVLFLSLGQSFVIWRQIVILHEEADTVYDSECSPFTQRNGRAPLKELIQLKHFKKWRYCATLIVYLTRWVAVRALKSPRIVLPPAVVASFRPTASHPPCPSALQSAKGVVNSYA